MSKEDIEVLYNEFERLSLNTEKPKFHKIVRKPGRERLLFLQQCFSQLCGEVQKQFPTTDAITWEEERELEEEIVKYAAVTGISRERRIVIGNSSERDNLLFWKKLLMLLQRYQSVRNKDNSLDWSKTRSCITELQHHPQFEKLLQPQQCKQQPLVASADISSSEVDLSLANSHDNQSEFCSMEQYQPPDTEQQEWNCINRTQGHLLRVQQLQQKLEEFVQLRKSFPRPETAHFSCIGKAVEQQCAQLKQITKFHSSIDKLKNAVEVLSSIEAPDVTATDSENLLFNNSHPDLLI